MSNIDISEQEFIRLAYRRFNEIYKEIMSEKFWAKSDYYRFCLTKDAFMIYRELIKHKSIEEAFSNLELGMGYSKNSKPVKTTKGLFKIIRHVFAHFPFFTTWKSAWVSKEIVNWNKRGQQIDNFFKENEGEEMINYTLTLKNVIIDFEIKIPNKYTKGEKIFLNEIISENDGVPFSLDLMKKILDNQIVK